MRILFVGFLFLGLAQASRLQGGLDFKVSTNIPGMKVTGNSKTALHTSFELQENGLKNISFSLNPTSLTTGMDLRDEHLHKFLKFKTISFKSAKGCKFIKNECGLKGSLSVAGIQRTVKIKLLKESGKYQLNYPLSLKNFNFKAPSFAGVTVKDTVELKFNFQ